MATRTTIDKAGRVVLPKHIRDALRLEPGDALDVSIEDGGLTLCPAGHRATLTQELGVWVFGTGRPVSEEVARRVLAAVREDRSQRL